MHGDLGLKGALQQASPGRWFYVTTLSPRDTLARSELLMAVGERTLTGLGQGNQRNIYIYIYIDRISIHLLQHVNMFHMTNMVVFFASYFNFAVATAVARD